MDLRSPISTLPGVGTWYSKRLEKLELKTIFDLLHHVPFRYQDYSEIHKISQFPVGEVATIRAEVLSVKNQYTKQGRQIQIAELYDGTGKILAVWFNQPFLARVLHPGVKAAFSGKLQWWTKQKALYSPEYEVLTDEQEGLHTGRLVPVYPQTAGVSSKWLRGKLFSVINSLREKDFIEFLPSELLTKLELNDFFLSIKNVHFPESLEIAAAARRRLSFNELLFIQLSNIFKKIDWQKNEATHKLIVEKNKLEKFISGLSFELTPSQRRSVEEILKDLEGKRPMNRLLEGDVGSGKTVVAAIASYITHLNNFEVAIMAPTVILAQQHYKTLSILFKPYGIGVHLLTGSDNIKSQKNTSIFVGTHSLIHNKIDLKKVALVVIDEQHRFGVEQRAHLITKTKNGLKAPHVLTMTATPIPRTIALTLYGELDLSILEEMPQGRVPITTWVVPPAKRDGAYGWIKEQIKANNSQVFIVCPIIEESDSETLQGVKSVKKEYEKIKKVFKQFSVGLLHGKLKPDEKNTVLDEFRSGKTQILVTTPVVEVGVDIPNATIMLIEGAERFGLSQLHQLRGRVGRGGKKSYCLLLTTEDSGGGIKRLEALKTHTSGFKLAEIDLALRGPGEILGTRQHGEANLKIASWLDIDLIKASKQVATLAVENPDKFAKLHKAYRDKLVIEN